MCIRDRNTEKPAATKEANISFYVFIDGHYKLIKNLNACLLYTSSAGTTALAVSANDESSLNINGSLEKEMLSEEFISEEESTSSAEETPKEEITPPSDRKSVV